MYLDSWYRRDTTISFVFKPGWGYFGGWSKLHGILSSSHTLYIIMAIICISSLETNSGHVAEAPARTCHFKAHFGIVLRPDANFFPRTIEPTFSHLKQNIIFLTYRAYFNSNLTLTLPLSGIKTRVPICPVSRSGEWPSTIKLAAIVLGTKIVQAGLLPGPLFWGAAIGPDIVGKNMKQYFWRNSIPFIVY